MVRYLQGPVSIYCWKVKEKTIWIFGDQHVVSEDCGKNKDKVYLEDLIKSELENVKPDYIDLFLEHDFSTRFVKEKEISYIYRVSNTFRNCYMPRKKCLYKNLRIHAADRRRELEPLHNIIALCHELNGYMFYCNTFEEKVNTLLTLQFDVKAVLNYLKEINQQCHNIDDCYTTLYNILKIHKQLSKIEDKKLAKKINKFFNLNNYESFYPYYSEHEHHSFIRMEIKEIIQVFSKFFIKKDQKVAKFLITFIEGMSSTSDVFMDKYLIGRIFKEATGNNIIMNVGFVHADTYNKFFSKLPYAKQLFKKEAPRQQEYFSQCLSMTPEKLFTRS